MLPLISDSRGRLTLVQALEEPVYVYYTGSNIFHLLRCSRSYLISQASTWELAISLIDSRTIHNANNLLPP